MCLQETADVAAQPQLHSLLPLSNRVVVPGERFREIYYWDSYWVVKGLLVSQMYETATVRGPWFNSRSCMNEFPLNGFSLSLSSRCACSFPCSLVTESLD